MRNVQRRVAVEPVLARHMPAGRATPARAAASAACGTPASAQRVAISMSRPPLHVIAGPTASGKSARAWRWRSARAAW
jgi:hypothetical protein